MSSGAKYSGDPNTYSYRAWNGGDGKYSVVDGFKQLNEHNYSLTAYKASGRPDIFYGLNYIPVDGVPPTVFDNNDAVKLQAKLVSAVRGHDFNLGKFVAEGKQSVDMAVSAIQSVSGAIHDLKRGNLLGAARRLGSTNHVSRLSHKDVAGRWLELQYGWLPLLSDVYEAHKAFVLLTAPPRKETVKVTRRVPFTYNSSQSPSNWSGYGKGFHSQTIKYRMIETLTPARSLGLRDPLGIAWEIIPYSFVVDWFVPIGTYLDNLSIIPKLKGVTIVTTSTEFHSRGVPKNLSYYKGASSTFDYLKVDRVVTNGLTTVTPGFNSIPEAMSPLRIANALALAVQRIK